jgi:hypothetical protein
LQITSFASKTWENYLQQGMGSNVWNIVFEAKYIIRLELGKEDMCYTFKSLTLELPHH